MERSQLMEKALGKMARTSSKCGRTQCGWCKFYWDTSSRRRAEPNVTASALKSTTCVCLAVPHEDTVQVLCRLRAKLSLCSRFRRNRLQLLHHCNTPRLVSVAAAVGFHQGSRGRPCRVDDPAMQVRQQCKIVIGTMILSESKGVGRSAPTLLLRRISLGSERAVWPTARQLSTVKILPRAL